MFAELRALQLYQKRACFAHSRGVLLIQDPDPKTLVTFSAENLSPVTALLFGILILIFPKFLNYLIAVYLIIIGLLGLGLFKNI